MKVDTYYIRPTSVDAVRLDNGESQSLVQALVGGQWITIEVVEDSQAEIRLYYWAKVFSMEESDEYHA